MDKDYTLLGVVLKGDNLGQDDRCLGAVKVPTSQIGEGTLDCLRDVMRRQLVCFFENLQFCTKEGWSIKAELENNLKIQDVLTDQRTILVQRNQKEDKIAIQNTDREVLGFVLCAVQSKLSHLRSLIQDQILDEGNRSFQGFQFLEQHGWPVSLRQEGSLSVLDVINERHVMIRFKTSPTRTSPQYKACTINRKRHLSFRSSKDLERVSPADSSVGDMTGSVKQILISYVRAEAAQHALRLKQELSHLGFTVYLDVHEIRSGLDWQDSLNYAVSNCEYFVALVTPKYGETQWTNREIKLADVLGKFIVPVSFLDCWPPQCLAIQFATTQYIDWKTQAQITAEISEGSNSAKDIKVWEHRHIREVASKIKDHLNKAKEKAIQKRTSLVKRRTVVKSCTLIEENNEQASMCNRDGCPLVVVCVHVNQQQLSIELADFIRSLGFEVWCTVTDKVGGKNEYSDIGDGVRESFQEKADDAGVVIVVLSSDFIHSKTCQQQLYYCEQRKKVVPFLTEDTQIPSWLEMMLQSNTYNCVEKRNYKEHLPKILTKLLDPKARQSSNAELEEARVSYAVKQLQKLLKNSLCIYICGPSVCENVKSDLIRLLGKVLSEFEDITVVTGGGYNVEYLVSHAFQEETQQKLRPHQVWHVLPEQEKEDVSKDYPQNSDGTFQVISFGQTYFCGNSLQERDLIVSKAVQVCLILIGDSDVKYLRLAKKFAWNDHHVIPFVMNMEVDSTFTEQLSHGISLEDFRGLNDPIGTPELRACVLRDILTRIQGNLEMEQKEEESQEIEMSPPKKMQRKSPSKGSNPSHKKVSLKSLNTIIL
ncbi:uncharacterized protein LOC134228434 isoform X2 [Saccostrea cucullata]|uniref:uncharacterized protein LOC134228434 isoform X2 n=1 Tax=Saccostrea cuccullata TaxID=36930 RepID=UPI002ED4FDA1